MPVAAFGDAQHHVPVATRVLTWDEPEPGCQMPAVLEFGAVPDRGDDGGRRLGPDALDLGDPLTGLRGAEDALDLVVEPVDPVIEVLEEIPELGDGLARDG